MATKQRRMLTVPSSKLGKIDLVARDISLSKPANSSLIQPKSKLQKEDAWAKLPREARERLYSLLPEPREGEPPHDVDLHPLQTHYKTYIQNELRRWQADLRDGRETKKWRDEAMQAGRDLVEGKFDEWKEIQKREYWGFPPGKIDENTPQKAEQDESATVVFRSPEKVTGNDQDTGTYPEEVMGQGHK